MCQQKAVLKGSNGSILRVASRHSKFKVDCPMKLSRHRGARTLPASQTNCFIVVCGQFFYRRYPFYQCPVLPHANDAKIHHILGTTVPENWIPFIATRNPGSNRQIHLQRASMRRVTDDIADSRIEPCRRILRIGLDEEGDREAYFLREEGVPPDKG